MKYIFKPSGSYDAYIDGSILITTIVGSWNLEMLRESSIQSGPLIEKLETIGQPWAVIVKFVDTMLTDPQVLLAGRKSVIDMLPVSKLAALAWVADKNIIGYPLLVPRYLKVYEDVLKSDFFTSIEDAKHWLNNLISMGEKINHVGILGD